MAVSGFHLAAEFLTPRFYRRKLFCFHGTDSTLNGLHLKAYFLASCFCRCELFSGGHTAKTFGQVAAQADLVTEFLDPGIQCLSILCQDAMRLKEFIQFGQSRRREGSLFIGREATETFGQVAAAQAGPTAEFPDLSIQCLSLIL